jgi:hypothetical protein
MSVVTQLYFQIVEEINYLFRPFSGWAIIRLRLEYRGELIYYNVENTVVLRRTFIHLISASIESHNGDDATKHFIHLFSV